MDYFAEYGISTPATVNVNFSAIAAGGLGVYFQRNFYDPIIAVLKANGRFVPGVRIGALVGDEFWYSLITHPDVRARWEAIEQRSEEHTSELQSLMRISYAVFCLKKTKTQP